MNAADAQEIRNTCCRATTSTVNSPTCTTSLDDRLQQLNAQHYLTDSEHLEEVTLKKRKLALKDQMERIASEWAREHSHN